MNGGENLLYEKRQDGTKICYIYLNGKPVARVEESSTGTRMIFYYHTDILGTTRVVTSSYGNVVENYDYDAFGNPYTSIERESLAFTSKGQDSSGLYYFNARYYDSSLGRFISEDPAKDGANWWVYCGNNPLGYVDPTGLDKIYYDQNANEIKREKFWWMFWDTYFILANDGKSFWPIQEALPPGNYKVVENGDQIFREFVEKNAPKTLWQNIFPFTIREVLNNSPSGKDWDIKRKYRNSVIIFEGQGYREDIFGNMTWGYIMASRGWPLQISKMGGGYAQTFMDNNSNLKFWLFNTFNLGDDPRDSDAIEHGYFLYYRKELLGW